MRGRNLLVAFHETSSPVQKSFMVRTHKLINLFETLFIFKAKNQKKPKNQKTKKKPKNQKTKKPKNQKSQKKQKKQKKQKNKKLKTKN
jgi:hypothetical protein